jgi:hypothetical protein
MIFLQKRIFKTYTIDRKARSKNIFLVFKILVVENKILLQNLSLMITDDAPAMIGKENGFIGACRKDPLFPKFILYRCLILQ